MALTGLRATVRRMLAGLRVPRRMVRLASALAVVCSVGLLALILVEDTSYASSFLPNVVRGDNGHIAEPGPAIDSVILPGSCVIFDEGILAIEANRFSSSSANCPQLVDAYGMWLANGMSPPASPPYPASFVATWKAYFETAQYLVLSVPGSDYIPWSPALVSWFDSHYSLVLSRPGAYVYVHYKGGN